MHAALRQSIRDRAGDRCEYCHVRQNAEPVFNFHIEHITARQHGDDSIESNLALACHHCNLHKGPNLTAIDPESGTVVLLFHPRLQWWDEHFSLIDGVVDGRTATGRATVRLLRMNAATRVRLRGFET